MAIRDLGSRGPSTVVLDPRIIKESPTDNTRDMDSLDTIAHIREMTDAILSEGNECFPPITVYQEANAVYVMSGWCRRRAHVLAMEEGAPIKGILCLVAPRKRPEDIALSILTANDGLPLTAIEKSKAVKRLQSFLWTTADIAKKTGWSISTVQNLISLHDAPDSILQMVKDGEVSATLATKIVKEKSPEEAEKILKSAVDTSKKAGKQKATESDLNRVREKKVQWNKVGPKLYQLLKSIYEIPANKKDKVWDKIALAGELLAKIEETQGGEL